MWGSGACPRWRTPKSTATTRRDAGCAGLALRWAAGTTGQGDNRYSKEQLGEWRVHTTGAYDERWFEGNTDADYWGTSHRFLIDAPTKFQEFLAVRLCEASTGVLHTSHRVLGLTRSRWCDRRRTCQTVTPTRGRRRRRVTRSPSALTLVEKPPLVFNTQLASPPPCRSSRRGPLRTSPQRATPQPAAST